MLKLTKKFLPKAVSSRASFPYSIPYSRLIRDCFIFFRKQNRRRHPTPKILLPIPDVTLRHSSDNHIFPQTFA